MKNSRSYKNTKRKPALFWFAVLISGWSLLTGTGCREKSDPEPVQATDSIYDVDSNVYKTVKIGSQWWMAENLEVKRFRDGQFIKDAQSISDWPDTAAAYCRYDNNGAAPGLLYNWFAVHDARKIAPAGWHVATDEDWKELERFLGMSQTETDKLSWRGTREGEKLKIQSPEGWTVFGDIWSDNTSGFTALAGGCRLFNGTWADPGLFSTGFWWCDSEHDDADAMYRYLDYKNAGVFRSHCAKTYGFSVRCVRDK